MSIYPMTSSIRTFLLVNLFVSVTIITTIAIVGNLYLAHKNVSINTDLQLVRTGLQIKAFFSDSISNRQLAIVQSAIHHSINAEKNPKLKELLEQSHDDQIFQIWNRHGQLILHSHKAPKMPISNGQVGFSSVWINHSLWRVNTIDDPANKISIMIGERSDFQNLIEGELTKNSILIMLVTYPLLGFLIWVIINKVLANINEVTKELTQRESTFLEPVDVNVAPKEIRPLVEALNKMLKRLQDTFEREKRFAADAAHELKTPLAALNTQAQVALYANTPEEQKAALRKVLAGVERSTHVIQQLLTLSRTVPEATINNTFVKVNLNRQASEVAALLAPDALKKGITLSLDAPGKPVILDANPTAIGILIRNLVDNAIRYTPSSGEIKIEIKDNPQNIILSVTDSGPGIPEDLREQVFQRFYRVLGNKAPGSGLGLSIIRQIASLHHAEILLLTPKSGKGLEARVVFPK